MGDNYFKVVVNDELSTCSKSEQQKLSWKTKIAFSFGHIYNDLTAGFWFSYFLLFFKFHFSDEQTSAMIFLGQIATAIFLLVVGFEADQKARFWFCRYGHKKTWHLLGSILVTCSFPFVFNSCLGCETASPWARFAYFSGFIIIYCFGWAAIQVSHVSLITDLTSLSSERVELNAYRQASTVFSSIIVYGITLFALGVDEEDRIRKSDSKEFTYITYILTGIGIFVTVPFHLFVKEPDQDAFKEMQTMCCKSNMDNSESNSLVDGESRYMISRESSQKDNVRWYKWLTKLDFWKICLIYVTSRLSVNITQVYTPLFLQDTLQMAKSSVAIIPFITYASGFVFSFFVKPLSNKFGSKMSLAVGCVFCVASGIWLYFGDTLTGSFTNWQIYAVSLIIGCGGSAMLISGLALVGDLIGDSNGSGAFAFSAMSFLDKLFNGVVIALVEKQNPPVIDESLPVAYYAHVLIYICGGAALVTLLGLLTILRQKYGSPAK